MNIKQLRLLLIEDNASHAKLIMGALRAAGIDFTERVATTQEQLELALQDLIPDLILSDFYLPNLDGLLALSICQNRCPDVPFIFVTGVLGEELAIETLKHGATDYVLKTHLPRLAPSVLSALMKAEDRAEKKRTEQMLREEMNAIHKGLEKDVSPMLSTLRDHLEEISRSQPIAPATLEKCLDFLQEAQEEVSGLLSRIDRIEKSLKELKRT